MDGYIKQLREDLLKDYSREDDPATENKIHKALMTLGGVSRGAIPHRRLCSVVHEEDPEDEVGHEDFPDDETDLLDITGQESGIQEARQEELNFMDGIRAWDLVDEREAWEVTGSSPVSVRWVDKNKGDVREPKWRSRLVARQFKQYNDDSMYAPMPPLEAKKTLMSLAASGIGGKRGRSDSRVKLAFVDIKKAYLNAKVREPTYIQLPPELSRLHPGMFARMNVSLYGTRAAASNWERCYSDLFIGHGFVKGVGAPNVFRHPEFDVSVVVHGDDFTILAEQPDVDWVIDFMKEAWSIEVRGILGPDPGDDKEVTILGRVVRWKDDGIYLEADPRHAEAIIEEMGVEFGNSVLTPGLRYDDEEDPNQAENIRDREHDTQFRRLVAKANFLALDRADIAFTVKELTRFMTAPTPAAWTLLKRLARYLRGKPRMVLHYPFQEMPSTIDAWVDADYAGCTRTRKSTSGGVLVFGRHVLKSWSNTQSVISLSSGESEYYAVVKGASVCLGHASLLGELGVESRARIMTDSSAAMGMAGKSGLGKTRHVETAQLWVQQQVRDGKFQLIKVSGKENISDLLTKFVDRATLDWCTEQLGLFEEEGRPSSVPLLH